MNTRTLRRLLMGASCLAFAAAAVPMPQAASAPARPATTADLGGAERYLTFVATDKPIYRSGERVLVRGTLLHAATHAPLADQQPANAVIDIVGPKGNVITSGSATSSDSTLAFGWQIPEGMAGGEYTVKVRYPWQGYTPAQRKFDIRAYRAPRLRSQIVFVHEGYGPGDKVSAALHTERAEGGIPAGATVTMTALVDGAQAWQGTARIDARGNCSAAFDLPAAIARGEGTLSFAIEDGGTVETASKTIPILLQTVDLAFYPEGGDLVAGLPNRVYFQALRPDKKPADIAGVVIDGDGTPAAEFKSEHEGRGRFRFTPRPGHAYQVRLTAPAGISRTFNLPAIKPAGAVLCADQDVYAADQPLMFSVHFPGNSGARLTLAQREVEVAAAPSDKWGVTTSPLFYRVQLDAKSADGVLVATLWDANGLPLAERLIYRRPARTLNISVAPDQSTYCPGGKATLNITTTDAAGKPVSGVVGLTVTDDAILEMIDKREQAPRLPAMALLEPEVQDLADAHVYLDPANPKAALATDLLLGTQGWRRFAFLHAADFMARYGDPAKRVLAVTIPEPPPAEMPALAERAGAIFKGAAVKMRAVGGAAMEPAAPGLAGRKEEAREEVGQAEDQPLGPAIKDLEQLRAAKALGQGWLMAQDGRAGDLLVIREFAHQLRPDWTAGTRSDFAETLYWSPAIKTDSQGHATVSFALSDSVTTFRALADGFDKAGALGTVSAAVVSVRPFYIEPKLPLEVTAGDTIALPVVVVNNTDKPLLDPTVAIDSGKGWHVEALRDDAQPLPPHGRVRRLFRISIADISAPIPLTITASAGGLADTVTRQLSVKPRGFPTQIAFGGLLEANSTINRTFTVPATIVPGSIQTSLSVYPSPVANLTEAVATLLREPCGCFEQTSSTSYPLTMAQQYFTTHQGVDPKLVQQAGEILTRGYQRLVGFECEKKGYEWFGGSAPGHEALTAYGLMQFHDMQKAQLSLLDPQMMQRTRAWLVARRDGKGGFQRNPQALDSFGGAPEATTNAYIVWALLESGETGLDKEVAAVLASAGATDDSYVIALGANVAALAGDSAAARALRDKLAHKQDATGAVSGAITSITRSGGEALAIETTALAVLAWLHDGRCAGNVENAIKWLADSCKQGRYGSTQSTVLALKAIIAYDQSRAHPTAAGSVTVLLDTKPVGAPVPFDAGAQEALRLPDISGLLAPGVHTLAIRMDHGSTMPCSAAINFSSLTPAGAPDCKLDLVVALKDAALREGAITEARVRVHNHTNKDAPTPVALIGIPGGLEVRHDQLKELLKSGKIDAYEVLGRDVVLYWRQLKAGVTVEIPLSLTAVVPGAYTGPASRVYEYYTDESKQWREGLAVTVAPAP